MAELAAQPTSIQSMYTWFAENRLQVNRRYQRKLVWTLEEKQRLVESILKKYPIPAILIAERENNPGTYEIIDGLQRLHAIMSFIEQGFPTLEGNHFNLEFFPTAKGRALEGTFEPADAAGSQLKSKDVSTILDYSLAVSVMRNATEADIDDVFGRINTYGHRLSDQERRQAGVENAFSDMVRTLACRFRGDVSEPVLSLQKMPAISIDLPKTKHGYSVKAEEVFWVREGILRSTDLRDSMDEQCIADIATSIVTGNVIERSREALDAVYQKSSSESSQTLAALNVYGAQRFSDEFAYCVGEVLKVCQEGSNDHLRDLLFKNETTNPFPSVFAIILIAFHELIFKEKRQISSYKGVKDGLTDLNSRIQTNRKSTSSSERRKNINAIKGLIGKSFIRRKNEIALGANHVALDIENIIRRSEVETANYELKQGMLELSPSRSIDPNIINKVNKTICAIANNGGEDIGKIVIGVTDKPADAARIKALDGITAQLIASRYVVGIAREAKQLGLALDKYVAKWRDGVKNSPLSEPLKSAVLSNFDYNNFYGLGVLVLSIPPQNDVSYFDGRVYFRSSDETIEADTAQQIAQIARRF